MVNYRQIIIWGVMYRHRQDKKGYKRMIGSMQRYVCNIIPLCSTSMIPKR